MANTYTWKIVGLDCYPTVESKNNVVFNAHWIAEATDGTHIVSTYGNKNLTYTSGAAFTDYVNLTEAIVIGWVKEALGNEQVASIQSSLDKQIANLTNPLVITPNLPWSS
jgi:hypothetical protein